ncbi:hypothetical protein KKF34_19810 [Myxococcota bacterium]|nr:hypothetical protein [Myxococcota bacterium]MBU1381444.1 hypothetical protein [Myxococcota bacterium]MBU1499135.1 hypothetical protein [Myxococcota bacterium]
MKFLVFFCLLIFSFSSHAQDKIEKLSIGGYGDIHLNINKGSDPDSFDLHRIVTYIGYQFSKKIRFNSEIEIEHAFVDSESGGYLMLESANIDFKINNVFKVTAGRFLTPIGLINQFHEPVFFNGVERPLFAKSLIPSTWSSDGIMISGKKGWFNFLLGIAGGLDGSGFNSIDGIRGGRVKERPGIDSPSALGRFVMTPFDRKNAYLSTGVSFFSGKVNRSNKGIDNQVDSLFTMIAADLQFRYSLLEITGEFAFTKLENSILLPSGVAESMLGFYIESAVSLPRSLVTRLNSHALKLFIRYEHINTQFKMFDGFEAYPQGKRNLITTGVSYFPAKNVVIKFDYTRISDSTDIVSHQFNAGIGFRFP